MARGGLNMNIIIFFNGTCVQEIRGHVVPFLFIAQYKNRT